MKKKLMLSVLIFLSVLSVHAQQPAGALDGKQYRIELMKDGKADSKESLVFDKGMMDPVQCHQYGFSSSAYQAKNSAGGITFAAICKSADEGTMGWQGKATGDKIEGSVAWMKEGQETVHYTFTGSIADK